MGGRRELAIRPRALADQAAVLRLLERVQEVDPYPPHRSGPGSAFLANPGELGAWVATDGPDIIGHVALGPRSAGSVMELAAERSGWAEADLAAVARLFVHPSWRHRGVGRRLLEASAAGSIELGRRPVLDVATHFRSATQLYEAAGWQRLGEVKITFRSPCSEHCRHEGDSIASFVYLGPG